MFKLSDDEIERAYKCIQHHGFSTLIPDPPEWQDLVSNWGAVKEQVSNLDLDNYLPTTPMRIFAPKSRYNLRVVTHLHPIDLLIYTALVLIVRDDIENARIPTSKKTVFSYRSKQNLENQLYHGDGAYQKYKEELLKRADMVSCKYVAIADIADFFPRLYQHRLENVIGTVATDERSESIARVLIQKFVRNLSGGASYGIPVGPYASRNLAEALLIDVDSALQVKRFKFVRWVDDFTFFCRSDTEAQHCLFYLSQWLFEKHGLTLQSAKTRIVPKSKFIADNLKTHENKLEEHGKVLKDLWSDISPYEDEKVELDADDRAELEQINFEELLQEALRNKDEIDYDMISFLLGRLSLIDEFKDEWRQTFVDLVLSNIEHLYPISDSIARFFKSFENLTKSERNKIATALLKPVLSSKIPPPDYYTMWILSVFIESDEWKNATKLAKVYEQTHSEVVRRYSALAIEKNGTRSEALLVQASYEQASPMLQLAILRATRLLGKDERKFWLRKQLVNGILEKKI
ncbi:MAG: hypothetical protein COB93_09010 [Sneathiella sp.]|nr:MAG: hypothetical protein COB93_09010 [Sneathiella sp.]